MSSSVNRVNTERLAPAQPGPAGKKPGGGTVYVKTEVVELPEDNLEPSKDQEEEPLKVYKGF